MVNIKARSSRNKKETREKRTDEKGQSDEGRFKPEIDFRSVWNADARAHSSTLQTRVWGREKRKEQ